jgi:hypothetical protein
MTLPRSGAVDGECRRNRRRQAAEPLVAGALFALEDDSDFDDSDFDVEPLLSLLPLEELLPFDPGPEADPVEPFDPFDPLRESVR